MSEQKAPDARTFTFEVERMTVRDPKTGHRFDMQMNPPPSIPITITGHTTDEAAQTLRDVLGWLQPADIDPDELVKQFTARLHGEKERGEQHGNSTNNAESSPAR